MAVASEAPPFWWEQQPDWRAWALSPFAFLYGSIASRRMARARREPISAPVLCIGNLTVGGEGKTPVAIALARQARKAGRKPGFLSRGHGGSHGKPHLVDGKRDSALLVGDEPLLLAREAPIVVSADRSAGARELMAEGCDFIIMDDGFQSAHLHMDYALIVVDARRGLGNGHVIPAGPLRAPVVDQMRYADALVTMGKGEAADPVVRQAARAGKPIFEAVLKPRRSRGLKGQRFLAFAGIGNPNKFFDTVEKTGGLLVERWPFPDHHPFSDDDVHELERAAAKGELELITTAKDHVRLTHGSAAMQSLAERVRVLEVDAVFSLPAMAETIVEDTVTAWQERSLKA